MSLHADYSNEMKSTQASVLMNLTFYWRLGGLARNRKEKRRIGVDSRDGENKARLGYGE